MTQGGGGAEMDAEELATKKSLWPGNRKGRAPEKVKFDSTKNESSTPCNRQQEKQEEKRVENNYFFMIQDQREKI